MENTSLKIYELKDLENGMNLKQFDDKIKKEMKKKEKPKTKPSEVFENFKENKKIKKKIKKPSMGKFTRKSDKINGYF
tara:strand:+ start:222 stop:455 length:234 start_codon:yes stop_codon:yes gene_type:complete